ncbi:related to Glucan 1,3-beta-glucosidase 2 [Zygosaccharomyces bailii ISA1307]|nr:related to Glucan 1,3-beta-glucosidase 2 [Zygosaccharomyces bailii ISA1307]
MNPPLTRFALQLSLCDVRTKSSMSSDRVRESFESNCGTMDPASTSLQAPKEQYHRIATTTVTHRIIHTSKPAKNSNTLRDKFNGERPTVIKGVTLGGWLLTEPYIIPSLYESALKLADNLGCNGTIVDEFTLCQVLGYEEAKSLLKAHFDSWIIEDDFRQISEDGFNLVRLPVGYWAWKEAMNAGNTSATLPIQIRMSVTDLHGAPGSQNGFDNSGQRIFYDELGWLATEESIQLTKTVWQVMFDSYMRLGDDSTIAGIQIVNEPFSFRLNREMMIKSYYEAFEIFKSHHDSPPTIKFVIHDAFLELSYWNSHFNPHHSELLEKYTNLTKNFDPQQVLVDHHRYEVFSDGQLCDYGESINEELSYHPAVVGEWSGALTDCARWLNGVGVGARYDGTYYNTTNVHADKASIGSCIFQSPVENWPKWYREEVRQFMEVQLVTYSTQTSGYIFWNYKTENAVEWYYLALKRNYMFPQPLDNYTCFEPNGSIKSAVSKPTTTDVHSIALVEENS